MKGLFLDDERNPSDVKWVNYINREDIEWKVVRTYNEFVDAIRYESFDCYSFDHDLQDYEMRPILHTESAFGTVIADPEIIIQERTGADCAKVLVTILDTDDNSMFYIHTKNPIGHDNIKSILFGKKC